MKPTFPPVLAISIYEFAALESSEANILDSKSVQKGRLFMLENAPFGVTLPVVDMERARRFYEETLGLKPVGEANPEMVQFGSGETPGVVLYRRDSPTTADHTIGGFVVDNVEETVDALAARGVVFEQYDMPGLKTDARGIATTGTSRAAWFKDTEGNILAVGQFD
ncbi:VOC family protein [Chloroflexota bacterium]